MGLNRERLEAAWPIVRSKLKREAKSHIGESPLNRKSNRAIDFDLVPPLLRGVRGDIHIFDRLESTNKTLWQLINNGAAPGTTVIADRQTSGRGQWGRQWSSPSGGLYLSIALTPNLPVANSFQLTLSSVWGIATALRAYDLPVLIKWPNDLILQGRKLGGILTETKIQAETVTKAVVGVGINWENSVPETGINLRSYQTEHQLDRISSLEMLAAITLHGIASGVELMLSEGVEQLLSGYLELLGSLGQTVEIAGHQGIITGVTPKGDLRVELQSPSHSRVNLIGLAGRSSLSTSSRSEILVKPGTIRLGYDTL